MHLRDVQNMQTVNSDDGTIMTGSNFRAIFFASSSSFSSLGKYNTADPRSEKPSRYWNNQSPHMFPCVPLLLIPPCNPFSCETLSFVVWGADLTLFSPTASLTMQRDLRLILTSSIHPLLKAVWIARQVQQLIQEHKHIFFLEMEMEKYGCKLAHNDACESELLHCFTFSFSVSGPYYCFISKNKLRCRVFVLQRVMVALVALFSRGYFRVQEVPTSCTFYNAPHQPWTVHSDASQTAHMEQKQEKTCCLLRVNGSINTAKHVRALSFTDQCRVVQGSDCCKCCCSDLK